MQRGSSDYRSGVSERAARVEAALQELLGLGTSDLPDTAAAAQRYPDLMPELEERLRTYRAIRAAAAQARTARSSGEPTDLLDAICADDLRFLREELHEYEVLERVQYGGQGIVYRALQRATKRIVAVKVLLDGPLATPRQRARFEREVELCSRLQHPHIVTIYESGVIRGRNFCAMEFVEGVPIDEYVLLHAPPVREIVRLFAQVCQAVHYAHQRGIIHRDLSPANIMVDLDGTPHILDFGLAKDVWMNGPEAAAVSTAGQIVGTLPYLSPEQVGGLDNAVDVRSDTYSLGVVLFQLLSGMLPYDDDGNPVALREHILNAEPPSLRAVCGPAAGEEHADAEAITRDLEMILRKALAKEKETRYQSAAALAADLERYLTGDAVEARAESRLYVLRKLVRRYRWAFGVAVGFLVLLGLGTATVTTLWIEATAQRDNARQAAQVAHGMFEKVVTEIEDAIQPLAGGIEVRDRLLGYVATDLPALENLAATDTELVGVLQRLHERQGDIAAAQGRRNDAARYYQTFLESAQRASVAAGAPPALRDAVARAHRKLAAVTDNAEDQFQRAIALGTDLVAEYPTVDRYAYALCLARVEFARRLYVVGNYAAGGEQIEEALALLEKANGRLCGDERWVALAALARERESEIRVKLGDGLRAIAALEECLQLREQLSATHPTNVEYRHKLLRASFNLGEAYRSAGRVTQAQQLFEQAIAAGAYLTVADPTVSDWTHDLIAAHDALAALTSKAGDYEQANRHCEDMVAMAVRLCGRDPSNVVWANLLAGAYSRRAEVSGLRIDPEASRADTEAAVAIREQLCLREPESATRLSQLAYAYDGLASCYRKTDQRALARVYYERAYRIREQLLAAQPDVFERNADVIFSQMKMATWHLDQRTAQDDRLAREFLCQAETGFLQLEADGKLAGQEASFAAWLPAIHRNQQIIENRAAQRAAAQSIGTNTSDQAAETP